MKILIWGGSGQLGSELAAAHSRVGPVHSAVLAPRSISISDLSGVQKFTLHHKPDVVLNAAAYTAVDEAEQDPEAAFRVNCTGAENVALAARSVRARVLYVSTEAVFDGTRSAPVAEGDICNPLSQYAKSKHAGEGAVLEVSEYNWVLRTSWLYSKKGTTNFPYRLVERLRATSDAVPVVTDLWGQPTPAELLARWILDFVFRQPPGGIFHAACSGLVSKHDWGVAIAQRNGFSSGRISETLQACFSNLAPRPPRVELNCSKMEAIFGEKLNSWDLAFREYG